MRSEKQFACLTFRHTGARKVTISHAIRISEIRYRAVRTHHADSGTCCHPQTPFPINFNTPYISVSKTGGCINDGVYLSLRSQLYQPISRGGPNMAAGIDQLINGVSMKTGPSGSLIKLFEIR